MLKPSAKPLSVSRRTSQALAVEFIHVPIDGHDLPDEVQAEVPRGVQRVERPVDGEADARSSVLLRQPVEDLGRPLQRRLLVGVEVA